MQVAAASHAQVSFWVRRRSVKAWPLQRALQCGIELAEALRYIHNEYPIPGFQLLHRDLKPDNMGFRADGSLVRHDPLPRVALPHIQNLIPEP